MRRRVATAGGCSHAILWSEKSGVLLSRFVAGCTTVDSTGTVEVPAADMVADVLSPPGGPLQRPREKGEVRDAGVGACASLLGGGRGRDDSAVGEGAGVGVHPARRSGGRREVVGEAGEQGGAVVGGSGAVSASASSSSSTTGW